MVKTKFKKAVSLMLAAVMSLTAFMGIGATTAFAAVGEKADVYLVDYPRSGDTNNNGEFIVQQHSVLGLHRIHIHISMYIMISMRRMMMLIIIL